jgi:hypothetical protein
MQFAHLRITTIGGQGSDNGSDAVPLDRRIHSVTIAAEFAAATTSSGNSSSAISRPARRAIASAILSSIAIILVRSDDTELLKGIDTTERVVMSAFDHTAEVERYAENADPRVLQKEIEA